MSIEAIKKALEGVTPDRVERLWWFLHIMSKSSGSTNADDDKWNWINAFCTDYEDDTFNRAEKLGFIKVSHDSFMETSKAGMTPAGFSFINFFEKAPSVSLISEIDRLQRENAELRNLADRFKLEAQGHAMEARTANSTIYEIYQIVTGAKGEPGNWRGAEPVRKYVSQLMIDASNHAADAETVRREREVERRRAEAAEAEVKRLQAELALSKPLYSRRQIEARVKLLEEALEPFAQFRTAKMPGRYTDAVGEYFVPSDFEKARTALASTGGEHHAE
ncbi:MAG: hypothetical protein AAGD15_01565 [Agrobacterium cavarae]|uniref:hypothetical protein n=1 Tax=Agrobacterium cavarae TaxID=2528239 RepID=UPI0031B44346